VTDYVVGINNSVGGEMMIRDTGWSVEFWIKSGNSDSWDGNLGWDGIVNGVYVSGSFYYGLPGGVWRQIGGWNVSTSQEVHFNKTTNSGSNGLGYSSRTEMKVWIQRSTVPPAPSQVQFSLITHDTVRTAFNGQGDGGSAILEWQLAFGTNGGAQTGAGNSLYSSGGTNNLTGLKPGQYYAAWARGRNANGWGAWSPGNSFYTLGGAFVKVAGVQKNAIPYVKVGGIWVRAIPYVKVAGVWKTTRT